MAPTEEAAPAAATPTLQEASDKIDQQVANLDLKIAKCDEDIRKHMAKGSNPAAKSQAMAVLKRKKMFEQQRDTLVAQQFNVDSLAFAQEQAEVTMMAVSAMKAGTAALKEQQKKVGITDVEQLTEDIEEVTDEMREINEVLARSSGVVDGADEDALAEEYAKMEEELAMQKMMGAGSGAVLSAATTVISPDDPLAAYMTPAAPVSGAQPAIPASAP